MTDTAIALSLNWDQVDEYISTLADIIRHDGVPQTIIGILRGGMVPAVLLAHQLAVRDVRGIEVTRTLTEQPNGEKAARPQIVNPVSVGVLDINADVLLVDDVAGSGATFDTSAALISHRVARVRRVALVVNTVNWERSKLVAPQQTLDYIGTTCAGWVHFPWEV
ncbi:MAG: phosphoribosyltransferase family protein [Actinophytocola sp.]|uniref:phosphoribosyltransferase n=1 Tax=Actinophytocola sp. TaxID=1872138 RepID=UPI003C75100C